MSVVPTDELIRRYQAGQTDLFEAIFDRYKDYVYRVAFSLVQQVEEAEEMVQEAFLDVLKALPRYQVEGPARFETWLYRVTVNRCKMRWRRKQLPATAWDETADRLGRVLHSEPDDDPEVAAEQAELRRSLWRAVGRLADIHRQVIVLRYGHDLSYDEIAQALDTNVGTIKSRLNAAHRKLQEMMESNNTPGSVSSRRARQNGISALLCWLWTGLQQAFAQRSERVWTAQPIVS
jgi:RNA polymerase sigma-70 factor (ECF subfamily)